ncbi:hypothetical protein Ddc_13436 [Ditylenchus destructor]|nr:hypothetical protein Ddc_13436 [Ditylenchus destructor]
MFIVFLAFLLLSFHAKLGSSNCPESQEWRQMENFERNNVTVLVRLGCNMYLWQGANYTGEHVKSTNYIWNVDNRHYRSALCNCSVGDLELLQCELREEWDVIKFCDFRKSDNGGLCSATLKHSYVKEGDGNETSLTITKSLKDLFADKILKSFGYERMATLLHVDSNDNAAYFVKSKNASQIKQRSYVCGQYHFLTPEVEKHNLKVENGPSVVQKLGEWIYNQDTETDYWTSSTTENYKTASRKCVEFGGRLVSIYKVDLIKALFESSTHDWWIHDNFQSNLGDITADDKEIDIQRSGDCRSYYFLVGKIMKSQLCGTKLNYICENSMFEFVFE